MKIALVSPFPAEANNIAGGVAAVTQYLADALVSVGHEVHIIAPGKSFAQKERRGALNITWLGNLLLPGFLVYAIVQRKKIFSLLTSIAPDIVHFEGSFGWSINCAFPYVVTIHGIAEKDAAFGGPLLKRIIASNLIRCAENIGRAKASQVISISPYATHLLQMNLKGQIHHIDNPIDGELFALANTSAQRQDKIVCVGVVGERKNTLGVIQSFARIKKHYLSVNLVICGQATSASYLEQCKQLVNSLGLEESVTFVGNLGREELYNQFLNAKALLMRSKQETAPMAIAEAMALGVPCIVPKEFGIPYMVTESKDGWFIDDETPDQKWKSIASMLQSDNWLAFSQAAREGAARYHPDIVASKTLAVYEKALLERNSK
jgi:glycosyltransferase involved in cell wall biosynthesis